MIKPHAPFQDGSTHAVNEYCPTCHGQFNPGLWDGDGMYRPENQQPPARGRSDLATHPDATGEAK